MSKETHQISEIIPVDGDMFGGEISLEGEFTFNCTHRSRSGDLVRAGFEFVSEFGGADCMMLGKRRYFAVSEIYRYKQGMICNTRLDQPLIELHFQLNGSARAIESSMDIELDINPGEANLMIVPPLNDTFELKEEMGGTIFTILLSKDYLTELSGRFPYQIEPIIARLKQKEFCFLFDQNLPISPRMYSVIRRIQKQGEELLAGSLFLEAQILDLLSLFFSQAERSATTSGYSLARADRERIYRAREILIEQLENPPTLAGLCRLVGTNEFKLKNGFKEIFGTTPYAYHLQHKLEQARTYILDTDLTISEIAYKIGYSDPAHLTKAFRKQYGIRPSDLR